MTLVVTPNQIDNATARHILTDIVRQLAATDVDAALELAYDAGLVTDTDLIGAWETGTDVLQRAGVLDVPAYSDESEQ